MPFALVDLQSSNMQLGAEVVPLTHSDWQVRLAPRSLALHAAPPGTMHPALLDPAPWQSAMVAHLLRLTTSAHCITACHSRSSALSPRATDALRRR